MTVLFTYINYYATTLCISQRRNRINVYRPDGGNLLRSISSAPTDVVRHAGRASAVDEH